MNLVRLEREGVPPSATQISGRLPALCDTSLREIRTLSYLLHPPMLDELGLLSAVRWFVGGLQTRSGLRVTLEAPPAMERLPAALERDLFFVVQEALLNVVRHSGSDTAEVRVERQATQVILQIRDDGRGMPRPSRRSNPVTGPSSVWASPACASGFDRTAAIWKSCRTNRVRQSSRTVPLQAEKRTDPPCSPERWPLRYRVLVVEDHEWWRRYICAELEQTSQWEVVGAVSDGIEAVQKARDLKPDLILLDVGLPGLNGIQAARRILAHDPSSRILFVTEQQSLDIAEVALGIGARGFIVKSDAGTRLVACDGSRGRRRAFHQCENGGPWFRRRWAGRAGDSAPRSWFYADESSLLDDYARFVEAALDAGNGLVMVFSRSRRDRLYQRLQRAASTSTAPSGRGDVSGWMCRRLCRASWSTAGLTKHDSGTPRALSSWKRRKARS